MLKNLFVTFGGLWLVASIICIVVAFPLGVAMLIVWFMFILAGAKAGV